MIQSGGFLGRLLGPLLKSGLPLLKNVNESSPKSILIPLGLTAAVSATHAKIHKKILGSESFDPKANGSDTATLIISKDEMEDIMKKS